MRATHKYTHICACDILIDKFSIRIARFLNIFCNCNFGGFI